MKTRKKLLIALLSATCLTAGAFGMVACGSADPQPDPTLYAIYNKYVADNPDSAKTYEEWLSEKLEIIAKPGTPGKDGENGKDAYELYIESLPDDAIQPSREEWIRDVLLGKDGDKGDKGVGIKSVDWSEDKTSLVITFDDDTTATVKLPDEVTHVHTYGEEVTVLVKATDENDGLGYKTCTDNDCEHVELVVISRFDYRITVKLPDGSPAVGAKVTVNSVELEADADGVASFLNTGKGRYKVTVELDDCLQVGTLTTSANGSEYTVQLAKPLASTDMPNLDNVGDKMTYALTVKGEQGKLSYDWDAVNLNFTSEEAAKYKVTVHDENILFYEYASEKRRYETASSINNVTDTVVLVVDNEALTAADSPYTFCITVEKMNPPKVGSVDLPIGFVADEKVTATAEANEDVYFAFSGYAGDYTFDAGSDVVLTYLGGNLLDPQSQLIQASPVRLGGGTTFYVMASSRSGNIEFTAVSNFAEGSKVKPKELTLGQAQNSTGNLMEAEWFKFSVEEAGEYNILITGLTENISLNVYETVSYDDMADESIWRVNSVYSSQQLAVGTYYLKSSVECGFTVVKYNPETDAGMSVNHPVETSEDGVFELSSSANKYFIYTAPAAGTLWFTSQNANFMVMKGEGFDGDGDFNNRGHFVSGDGYVSFIDSHTYTTVTAGQKVYFYAYATTAEGEHNVELVFTAEGAETKVAYTVKVVDNAGAPVPGAQVSLTKGGETVAEAAATDADGNVTFSNMAPGVYKVTITDLDGYQYNSTVNTVEAYKDCETVVTLQKLYEYTITVSDGSSNVDGVKVTVRGTVQGASVSETATTVDGVATFKLPYATYYISVEADGYVWDNSNQGNDIRGLENEDGTLSGGSRTVYVKVNLTSAEVNFTGNTANFTSQANTQYSTTYDTSKKLVVTVSGGSFVSFTSGGGYLKFISGGVFDAENGNVGTLGMSFENNVLTIDPSKSTNSGMLPYISKDFVFVFSAGANVTFEYVSNGETDPSDDDWSTPHEVEAYKNYVFKATGDKMFTVTVTNGWINWLMLGDDPYSWDYEPYIASGEIQDEANGDTKFDWGNEFGSYKTDDQGRVISISWISMSDGSFNINFDGAKGATITVTTVSTDY